MEDYKETISLLFGGDFYVTPKVEDQLLEPKDKALKPLYDQFKKVDFSNINLEAPILEKETNLRGIAKIGPNLLMSEKVILELKKQGLSSVCLANNHIYDYGHLGLESTLNSLDKIGLQYVGASTAERKSKRNPLTFSIRGRRVTILNFAENEFSTINEEEGANPLNIIENYYDIIEAKRYSDYLIVVVHSGVEHYRLPTPDMKKWFHFFVDIGADTVICHHSHCYSGFELYKEKPIFYGLGNLSFVEEGNNSFKWTHGYLVKLKLNENISFEIIPYKQGSTENLGISYLVGKELSFFKKDIKKLNSIIENDSLLKQEYALLIETKAKYYESYFYPYSSRGLRFLARKKVIPSFISEKKRLLITNLIRCEAHRNLTSESLTYLLNKKKNENRNIL